MSSLPLKRVLERAWNAPFWRTRLAAAGYTPDLDDRARDDVLGRLRPLAKDDLLENAPPRSDAMLTGPLEAAYVFRTGGTTGEPKFSVFASAEFQAMVSGFVTAYRAAGLDPGDRVANVFTAGSLYASFVFVNRCLEEIGVVNLPYTMSAPPELVASQWDLFGLTAVMGFPSHLVRIVRAIGPGKVQKVFFAGEHLHDEDRRILTEDFGIGHIASGGYGAVDTGLMGFQCLACSGATHHVLADHARLDIVDPETLEPVGDGEVGQVLVTCLDRLLMPVIRYDIGDRARWIPGPCPCGRPEPRFELLGRGGDTLRIGYANVAHDEIARSLGPAAAAVQLVKERVDGKDLLRIRFEPRPVGSGPPRTPAPDDPMPIEQLIARILEAKPDLGRMTGNGQIAPIVVEAVAPGDLPRSQLTGKQIKVEDRSLR